MLLEDSLGAILDDCMFEMNGASGSLGADSYASSGTGGALALKFSTASVTRSSFVQNWVSVGGTQMSAGGALAG